MAEYTSGQYKWMLFQRLRQAFSMGSGKERAYTQTFFLQLFDDSITVTEESYNNFVTLMNQELDYMAELGIYNCESIPIRYVEEKQFLLINSFAQIGIQLTFGPLEGNGGGYKATFIKPNGHIMVYVVTLLENYFYINARAGTEYNYAKLTASTYDFTKNVQDVDSMNPRIAGPNTWWSYDATGTGTMTISGDGAYVGVTEETQLGSGSYTTLIIGAQVSRLCPDSVSIVDGGTIVILAPVDMPMQLDSGFISGVKDGQRSITIYADNLDFRNYDFPTSLTIEWHTLDEWEG